MKARRRCRLRVKRGLKSLKVTVIVLLARMSLAREAWIEILLYYIFDYSDSDVACA